MELETSNEEEALKKYSDLLRKSVNFGGQILRWETQLVEGGDENLPIILSFRHFVQLIDSVSILMEKSSIEPCKVLLRAACEAYLSLEYILEKDSENRALSFLVVVFINKIEQLKNYDETSAEGIEFQKKVRDKNFDTGLIIDKAIIDNNVRKLEHLLNKAAYQPIVREYEKIKGKYPNWFQLFEGPRNVRELASRLNLSGIYETIYSDFSGHVHGKDIILKNIRQEENGFSIPGIRLSDEMKLIFNTNVFLCGVAYELYVNSRVPHRKVELLEWAKIIGPEL